MKFDLINLGCKVNRVEADSIGAQLISAGWQQVSQNADVAIVNTCTVTAEAHRKTRKEINRTLARNPDASLVVTGCAASIDPASLEALSERISIVPKDKVVAHCLSHDGHHSYQREQALRVGDAFPTRVGIKVQDGCDNACTFCIVHVARGKASSVPLEACIDQAKRYEDAGVREIVLTGIDLGAYRDGNHTLIDLVQHLRRHVATVRLRISSIEVNTMSRAFIEEVASHDGMVCRHFHVPLQSGSNKVLKDMARHYTVERYVDKITELRSVMPCVSLSTDVIVGFPGETDDDFAQTVDVAQQCGFSRMHIFRYSKRDGTPAARRTDQVAAPVKAARAHTLSDVAARLRLEDARKRIGTSELVLVESSQCGMSESYFDVRMPQSAKRGSLERVVLKQVGEDGVFSL